MIATIAAAAATTVGKIATVNVGCSIAATDATTKVAIVATTTTSGWLTVITDD